MMYILGFEWFTVMNVLNLIRLFIIEYLNTKNNYFQHSAENRQQSIPFKYIS